MDDARRIAEAASKLTQRVDGPKEASHPFELRGFAGTFPEKVQGLFDDGHYSDAVFTALKYFDKLVQRHSKATDIGKALMMLAFRESSPPITMGDLSTETGRNQQEGFKFLSAGSMLFLRDPRGHEVHLADSADDCLDYLAIVATLIRELVKAGYNK